MSLYSDQDIRLVIEKNDDEIPVNDNKALYTAYIFYLIVCLWAVFLALKVSDKEHRILHVSLALALGPFYVLSYYLGMMKENSL